MKIKKVTETLFIFLKGLAMGSADIIPGVSGGTIALITGIYERFVFALQSINIHFLYYFMLGFFDKKNFRKAKKSFFSIDFPFLIPLAFGILLAFLTLANIIGFLLDEMPTQTYAFFFGLIFASAFHVYLSHKKLFDFSSLFFISIGVICGFFIVGLQEIGLNHSYIMIFLAGLIAVCAMILPGISGAFILLILGQYEFLLNILRDLTHLKFSMLPIIAAFGFGGIIGLIGFSRVLSFLFSKYKSATIAFITGLMIGALRKPGMEMLSSSENLFFTVVSLLFGIFIVTLFSVYELKKKPITHK